MTVQPYNQWDASLQLDVPLVDLGSHARYRAQLAQADVSRASEEVTRLEVQKQVVRSWYQLVGSKALTDSASKSLELAQANAKQVSDRRDGGIASDLDVQRAEANIERAKQDVSDAELIGTLSRRNLETLTGVAPQAVDIGPSDDLHEEIALSTWLGVARSSAPMLQQAAAQVRATEQNANAAKTAYLPSLSGNAQQRFTNATGFSGHSSYYTISAVLSWRLDFGIGPTVRAQNATVDASLAQQDRITRSVQDQVHESWHRVQTGIAKSRAARAQVAAADKAASIASDRYTNGASTQIEVIQAQRDLFAAEVARIQADADLAAARAMLRLNAGRNP
jgi:outer membrane protein TolC